MTANIHVIANSNYNSILIQSSHIYRQTRIWAFLPRIRSDFSPTMATYSAWFVVRRGLPSKALELKTGLSIPTKLADGHVLVKVHAVALNPVGYKLMRTLPDFLDGRPHIAELDMAGVVVDPNGSEFGVGDKVFGGTPDVKRGTLAEYVVFPSSALALTPPNVSAVEAAGLAVVNLTAYQTLMTLKIDSGQTIFINGGSSSVGMAAIQIAKFMGCKVVATASGRNKDLLLNLGVDEFIDYTAEPLSERLLKQPPTPKFHAIYDAAGLTDPALYLNSTAYLAPDGMYITAGTMPKTGKEFVEMLRQIFEGMFRPTWLGGVPREFGVSMVQFEKKSLEIVRDLVAQGALKPKVDSVHTFDRDGVMQAYEKLMTKHAVGKVVIKVVNENE
ncbi:hypothetical protein B0H15DRAFT_861309 [Mycena belliarum]|uniref:Enoyl reductase (ER) domain-containing protein n=1 Tax=Mycena belliarum TaxID=1033014 RepID=A0AAD6TUJ8_9AGAR|nr:hypothetical protein B0H15DRAFT_861309 [Mycena belliae]